MQSENITGVDIHPLNFPIECCRFKVIITIDRTYSHWRRGPLALVQLL